ncbi:MAG TPA: acyltransferase [Steroidobacteraceae bacterium]|nr:acyltransferase [Steroidobacteraceae bacterium]
MTGLRGIAALIVVWFHMKDALAQRGLEIHLPVIWERLFFNGGHSVDVFFVLSGFILALTYRHWFGEGISAEHYWRFMRRRFARIYPLHLALLLLVAGFVGLARLKGLATLHGLDRFDFATLPQYLLLVQAWGPFLDGIGEWNPPAWSISIEVLAYAVLPALAWITVREARRRWLLVAAAAAIGFLCNTLTHWSTSGFAGVSRGLSEFAFGVVSVNLLTVGAARWLQTTIGSCAALAGLLIACAAVEDTGFVVAFFTLPLLIALCAQNAAARVFSWGPLHYLGEISYSIYLGHFLFTAIIWRLLSAAWATGGAAPMVTSFVIANLLVVGFASLTYFAIERPGRRLLRDHTLRAVRHA